MSHPPLVRTTHFALHMVRLDGAMPAPSAALFQGDAESAWVGCVLPKRHARRAVTRNTLRRQIYASVARHCQVLPGAAWVARLQRGWDLQASRSATSEHLKAQVRAELEVLFDAASEQLRHLQTRQRPPA